MRLPWRSCYFITSETFHSCYSHADNTAIHYVFVVVACVDASFFSVSLLLCTGPEFIDHSHYYDIFFVFLLQYRCYPRRVTRLTSDNKKTLYFPPRSLCPHREVLDLNRHTHTNRATTKIIVKKRYLEPTAQQSNNNSSTKSSKSEGKKAVPNLVQIEISLLYRKSFLHIYT